VKIKLAADLEKALLRSIAEGTSKPDIVSAEELSKTARQAYESICHLLKHKAEPPLRPDAILLQAQALFGVEKEDFKDYLRTFGDLRIGSEAGAIAKSAREKAFLVRLVNEAGQQLAQGHLDTSAIARMVEGGTGSSADALTPLSSYVKDKFPVPARGLQLKSLPALSEASNGLAGMWIIGGEPGLGKTTLAAQMALDAGAEAPVIYHDLDGTGREWLVDRLRRVCRNSVSEFKKLTRQFHFRETVDSLDDDIAQLRKQHTGKIVVVIDSLQTLPTSIKYKKEGLDSWINRLKQLTKKNVAVLAVSEQNRANYGQPNMGGYKGTGDIEYAGSLCIQLLQDEDADQDDPVQLHIVKNRHGKRKGHIVDLERDTKREFWFEELEPE
jgi:hypothetical protein